MRIIKLTDDVWDASSVYDSAREQTLDATIAELSEDVQDAGKKADSALQEMHDDYRTAAAQDEIDEAQDAEIAGVKSAMAFENVGTHTIESDELIRGKINTSGEIEPHTKRLCTQKLPVLPGTTVKFVAGETITSVYYAFYYEDGSFVSGDWFSGYKELTIDYTGKIIFVFRATNTNQNITTADYDATLEINTHIQNEISGVSDPVFDIISPFSSVAGGTYTTPEIGYYVNEKYQKKIRGKKLSSISLTIGTAGTLSIVKSSDIGKESPTCTVIKTFVIGHTGSVELLLDGVEIGNDEWFGIGYYSDTAIPIASRQNIPSDYSFKFYETGTGWREVNTVSLNFKLRGGFNTVSEIGKLKDGNNTLYSIKSANRYKMLAIGDSITYGFNAEKSYVDFLSEWLGVEATNMGIRGSTMSTVGGHPICNRVGDYTGDYDLIFLFAGTNDFGKNAPLGTLFVMDGTTRVINTTKSTFYGAVNSSLIQLITNHPTADIFIITPLHRGTFYSSTDRIDTMPNTQNLYLSDYVDAIIDSAKQFSIPVINLYADSGMNPNIASIQSMYFNHSYSDVADHLHPDTNGQERIAKIILSKI